jgi:hypothetical protein
LSGQNIPVRVAGSPEKEDERRLRAVDPGKLLPDEVFRAEGLRQRLARGTLPDEAV